MGFNPDNYETVEERLVRWWAAYPNAQIVTTMVHYDGKTVVFRAEGIVEGRVIASGYAEEVHGSSPVNKTSFVENCETSAIGRMIGNSPLGTKPGARPSRQEMQKVERQGGNVVQAGSALAGIVTERQLQYIKKLAKNRGLDDEGLFDECQSRFNAVPELLTARQASQLIESWK
jgi:hypothetical protein